MPVSLHARERRVQVIGDMVQLVAGQRGVWTRLLVRLGAPRAPRRPRARSERSRTLYVHVLPTTIWAVSELPLCKMVLELSGGTGGVHRSKIGSVRVLWVHAVCTDAARARRK